MLQVIAAILTELGIISDVKAVVDYLGEHFGIFKPTEVTPRLVLDAVRALEDDEDRLCSYDDIDDMEDIYRGAPYIWNR